MHNTPQTLCSAWVTQEEHMDRQSPAAQGEEGMQWIPEADQDLAGLARKYRMLRLALGAVCTASD